MGSIVGGNGGGGSTGVFFMANSDIRTEEENAVPLLLFTLRLYNFTTKCFCESHGLSRLSHPKFWKDNNLGLTKW